MRQLRQGWREGERRQRAASVGSSRLGGILDARSRKLELLNVREFELLLNHAAQGLQVLGECPYAFG